MGGRWTWVAEVAFLATGILVAGCARARTMEWAAAVAARDPVALAAVAPGPVTVRGEVLLPASRGRPLAGDEVAVEVWSGDRHAGWIYVRRQGDRLARTGWQRVGDEPVADPGPPIPIDALAGHGGTWHLLDGREGRSPGP